MQITLTVENVTPLFIAGADQRHIENEGLRAPSLRGLMRWWFRAIMGGFLKDVKMLKDKEKEVFGSISRKSSINILVREQNVRRDVFKNLIGEFIKSRGQKYLWFNMTYGGNENREVYLPGSTFTIKMWSNDQKNLDLALGALWCLIYLGGIGTRARRGGGNVKVLREEGVKNIEFIFKGNNVNDAKKFIEKNLQNIFSLYLNYVGRRSGHLNQMCVLNKDCAEIILVNREFDDFRDALSYIGEMYIEYRKSLRPWQRYTLGLPFGRPLTDRQTGERLDKLRLSSPILFGVMSLNEKYAIRITKFFSSIHYKFKDRQIRVKRNLNDFDSRLKEMQILIPEGKSL